MGGKEGFGGGSCSSPRRLVRGLGVEESTTFDGRSWASVFQPDVHGARRAAADLHRLFAEAAKLLLGIKPRDQARLVATRAPDGYWEVHADSHHETAAQEA